jgi:hypothetical protein
MGSVMDLVVGSGLGLESVMRQESATERAAGRRVSFVSLRWSMTTSLTCYRTP